MKKLLLLLVIFCLGQIAIAQNYVGLPKYMLISDVSTNPALKNESFKTYKDSAVLLFKHPAEKYIYYFKDDICNKFTITSDSANYNFYRKDCDKNFGNPIAVNIWIAKGVYAEIPDYKYIITLNKIENKVIYTISGYSDYLEYSTQVGYIKYFWGLLKALI